ncbi:MAG: PilN domain-containing protein, partial [Candidatus Omnitrophica bacterium]|nr:PilN domain-containing protein [Candidatus Omnitrophota bacterium]
LLLADIAELTDQVQLSLESYQRERLGPDVRNMLILSTAKGRTALKERFEDELGISVGICDPSDNIFCAPDLNKSALQACQPTSITAEMGLLLSETKGLVNLTPGEVHEAKQKKKEKHRIVEFVSLLLIAAALGISGQLVDIYKKGKVLGTLKGEIARLQPQLEEAGRKQRAVAFFDQKLSNYSFIPDLIDELTRLTPEEISFRTLSLDEERGLVIQGYAETHAGINDFQARLIRSERFHDVDLKFATKRKIANMPVMDFKIVSRLNGEEEGGQ